MEDAKFYKAVFSLALNMLSRLLTFLDPIHVNGTGLIFLLYIGAHKGCKVSTLAHAVRMDKAAVTRGLHALGTMGFVERRRAKMDDRTFTLYLTSAGRQILQGTTGILDAWEEEFRASAGEEEYASLFETLHKVREEMIQNLARSEMESSDPDKLFSFMA